MLSPEDRIMDVFYKNYPDLDKHSADRNCVADMLEFVLDEFAYQPVLYDNAVVDVVDLYRLIDALRNTVTLDPVTFEEK